MFYLLILQIPVIKNKNNNLAIHYIQGLSLQLLLLTITNNHKAFFNVYIYKSKIKFHLKKRSFFILKSRLTHQFQITFISR